MDHWAADVELEGGSESVRFDLTAGVAWTGSRIRGVLVVSESPYLRSHSLTGAVILEGKDANVGKRLWPILRAKMDEYVFAELSSLAAEGRRALE